MELEIKYIKVEEIKPYENNPRKNDDAVKIVVKSINEFGFRNPIILDKNNEIIAGHTRYKAAKQLKYEEVPVLYADNLTPEQVKAFRIMDNKSQEHALWDYDLLKTEMFELKDNNYDLDLTGFSDHEINFFSEDEDKRANNPYEEWRKSGNIEYHNEDKTGFRTLLVHFPDEASITSFAELVNQTITDKTKFIWYPKQADDKVAKLKYEEK